MLSGPVACLLCGLGDRACATLGKTGLGARTGFGLVVVAGDEGERSPLLGVAGDRPGFGDWTIFGLGARGGLRRPEFNIALPFHFAPLLFLSSVNQSKRYGQSFIHEDMDSKG